MKPDTEMPMKLDELAERGGVSPRTVRYYVQRGLLPAPVFRGRDTVYSEDHLLRLRAIKRLQDRFMPLDAIQVELSRSSREDLRRLADGTTAPAVVGPGVVRAMPSREQIRAATRQVVVVAPRPAANTATRWMRFEIVPGVEIHVADGTDGSARVLADELRAHAERWLRDRQVKE